MQRALFKTPISMDDVKLVAQYNNIHGVQGHMSIF